MIRFNSAVLFELGSPPEVWELQTPRLERGQVLVRMRMAGICGSQVSEMFGHKGNAKYIPHTLGHEGVGIVEAVGADVTRVSPGERVVLHWRKSTGIDALPAKYMSDRDISVGAGAVTTLGEYAVVSENRATPIPDFVSDEIATLMGCPLSTATAALIKEGMASRQDRILVVGLGGVGLATLMATKLLGSSDVFVYDLDSRKAAAASAIRRIVNCSGPSGSGTVDFSSVGPEGFDVVIDTVASSDVLRAYAPFLRPAARVVMVGQGDPQEELSLGPRGEWFKSESAHLILSQGGGFNPEEDMLNFLTEFSKASISEEGVITDFFSFASFQDAFSKQLEGSGGRVVIRFD